MINKFLQESEHSSPCFTGYVEKGEVTGACGNAHTFRYEQSQIVHANAFRTEFT